MAFLALPRSSRDIYEELGYREKLDAVDEGIRRYVFLGLIDIAGVISDHCTLHSGRGEISGKKGTS